MILIILLISIFFSSCISLTSYQTAEVLKKGEDKGVVGLVSMIPSKIFKKETMSQNEDDFDKLIGVPYPEFMFRTGLGKNIDMGVKFKTFALLLAYLNLELDMKYQLLQFGNRETNNLTLSIQPSLSYIGLREDEYIHLFNLSFATIVSKRFNKSNVLYVNIRYNFGNFFLEDIAVKKTPDIKNYFSATIGYSLELSLHRKLYLYPEITIVSDFKKGFALMPALGFGF